MPYKYVPLNLKPYFNRKGCTRTDDYGSGGITLRGLSYPEEEMPFGRLMTVANVPFLLEKTDEFDHIETVGQICRFAPIRATAIHVLGTGSDGDMATSIVLMQGETAKSNARIGLSLHMSLEPLFGNYRAVTFTKTHMPFGPLPQLSLRLWGTSVALEHAVDIDSIQFEDHPCIRIFAITLEGDASYDDVYDSSRPTS